MSLKGIELQIAIPKTFDAGKMAEQKQQFIQAGQEHANLLTEREQARNRETVVKSDRSAKMDSESGKGESEQTAREQSRKKNDNNESEMAHPYKGAFVDFTG
ncbi:ornithine carbamoyltransferase [Sporosarcina luteola]|nr:ornithine carbamoyltransferase [Sporosarcina luteola]